MALILYGYILIPWAVGGWDGRQRAPGEIFVPCARVCPCIRQAESYAGGLSRYFVNGCKTDGLLESVLL